MYRSAFARRAGASVLLVLAAQAAGLPVVSGAAHAVPPGARLVLLPVVAGPGVADRSAQRLTTLLRAELERRADELTLLPAVEARPEGRAPPNPHAMLEAAKKDLATLQLDDASMKLKRAIDAAWRAPTQATVALLADGYLSLAVADFRRGDERGARAALSALVRIQPGFQVPAAAAFPPAFVRELERAHRRMEKAPKASLTVEGPAGARATVDGVEIGMVPETQDGLAPGLHLVSVETTDGLRTAVAAEVNGQPVKVVAPFEGPVTSGFAANLALPAPTRGTLDARLATELGTYLQAAGADAALVVAVRRSPSDTELQLVPALYSRRRNAFALLSPTSVGADLVTANVDIFKVATEVHKQLGAFGPVIPLPHLLLPPTPVAALSAPKSTAASTRVGASNAVGSSGGPRGPLASAPAQALAPRDRSERTSAPAPASAPPATLALAPLAPAPEVQAPPPGDGSARVDLGGRIPWWVWVVGGVGLAAAAGGTYYGVSQATRPVTGTVTARW